MTKIKPTLTSNNFSLLFFHDCLGGGFVGKQKILTGGYYIDAVWIQRYNNEVRMSC